jgi:hypothetical protein
MTNRLKSPKALLRDHDLIGFVRSKSGGEHLVQRASSAKVFAIETTDISDPAKVSPVGTPRPVRKSNTA